MSTAPPMPAEEATAASPPPGGRLPWALIIALVLMAAVELWVRTWPVAAQVAYRDDADQAAAVRKVIEITPEPDVALVGSSMTYQGFAVPELQDRLAQLLGRPVTVANFAVRGGRVDLFEATIRAMLRQKTRPKLIVVGIAMRDLREHDLELDRLSQFWTLGDWRREARAAGGWLSDELPQVIRNEIGRVYRTLAFRKGIALRVERLFIDIDAEPMPALGDRPSQHLGSRRDQTLVEQMDDWNRPTNKRRMLQAYRPELGASPPRVLSDRVGAIINDCRRAKVKLMFVDLPLSAPLRELIDTAQRKTKKAESSRQWDPAYRRAVQKWTIKAKVPFIQQAELKVDWTNADFYDGQHLNYAGAVKMSEAIAPKIAAMLAP